MASRESSLTSIGLPTVEFTEFEVFYGRTLRMVGFVDATSRAEVYDEMLEQWKASPQALDDSMESCQPLAWAVHSIYSNIRDELEADIAAIQGAGRTSGNRIAVLVARLKALPEEPEEGAAEWLLGLSATEFATIVVPEIEKWYAEPPCWGDEDDHFPKPVTAQGMAFHFFENMELNDLEALGVEIVEGDHLGSSYCAAELEGDVSEANRIAEQRGIVVRFKQGSE